MFQSYEYFLKSMDEPVESDIANEELKPLFFNRYSSSYSQTSEFDEEVKSFRDEVNSAKYRQQRIIAAAKSPYTKEAENSLLQFLNQIDVHPRTVEELCDSQKAFDAFNTGSHWEMDKYLKEKQERIQRKIEAERERNSKYYTRDMVLAWVLPILILVGIPLFVGTCGFFSSKGSFLFDHVWNLAWIFLPIITGPIAIFAIIPSTNAVNKKHGYEEDTVTNGVLIASAIGCAISNVKGLKDGTESLLNQGTNKKV